jgi:hypothetical protein
MKHAPLLLRRTHLYLGMFLLPWTLMYGLSTVLFNHGPYFRQLRPTEPAWTRLWEKEYVLEVPAGNDRLRETARRVLDEHGLSGAFGAQRQGPRLVINVPSFRQPVRLTYDPDRKQLRAEERVFSWVEVLIRLHQRVGYGQGDFLYKVWGALVDLFCVGTLAWIGTGLYLWWRLPATRTWGWIALGGGLATLLVLLGTL